MYKGTWQELKTVQREIDEVEAEIRILQQARNVLEQHRAAIHRLLGENLRAK